MTGTKEFMMLRLPAFIFILSALLPTAIVADVFYTFKEGLEYERINTPLAEGKTNRMTVMELFRYSCAICYEMETTSAAAWLKGKPGDVDYVRVPFTGSEVATLHALVFYTIEALGFLDPLHMAFYDRQKYVKTEDEAVEFFVDNGVTREAFYKAFNSVEVRRNLQKADELSQKFMRGGLPAFVVNNKFLIPDNRLFSTDVYLKVVDQLLAEERSLLLKK